MLISLNVSLEEAFAFLKLLIAKYDILPYLNVNIEMYLITTCLTDRSNPLYTLKDLITLRV